MDFPEIIYDSQPGWVRLYQTAVTLALENVDSTEYRPGWLPQMTCMPGVGKIWQWDSCFMAVYAKYLNGVIAPMNNLDDLYMLQRDDGYISMAYMIETGEPAFGERINPPLYAWTEWEYYRLSGDLARVKRVLPVLIRYFDWLKQNRRRPCGLYYFEDSGSSGMDNSPRSEYVAEDLKGSGICWVDLACQQVLSARCLVKLADAAGLPDVASRFEKEADELAALINAHHFNYNTMFYHDFFVSTFNALANKTVAGFWPLLAGITDTARTDALVGHLSDPKEFATPHPVPSLSRDDPNYVKAGGYWKGSVWHPTNYMVVKGLDTCGYHAYAREIAIRDIDMMAQVLADPAYGSIWEAYAPEAARPATRSKNSGMNGGLVRDRFVGWGALMPVAGFIEHVIGLDFRGFENRVSWRIAERGRHGIRNLRFGRDCTASLVCDGLKGTGSTVIHVETTSPFTLDVLVEGRSAEKPVSFEVPAGTSDFTA